MTQKHYRITDEVVFVVGMPSSTAVVLARNIPNHFGTSALSFAREAFAANLVATPVINSYFRVGVTSE